jgi:hypothetical protein
MKKQIYSAIGKMVILQILPVISISFWTKSGFNIEINDFNENEKYY